MVEKATTFLKSFSKFAIKPPIINVDIPITNGIKLIFNSYNGSSIKASKKIPAVTNVEEWTIAEIGVGADIAAGSHLDKGNWALFENAQIKSKKPHIGE